MLRRKPTAITITAEDIAAFEDSRKENKPDSNGNKNATGTSLDPNDEIKPLPGDKARIARSRDERLGMRGPG
jgi:hypothetical protein